MAGHPIGEKAPIGNTDCPIGYGLYPLASKPMALSRYRFPQYPQLYPLLEASQRANQKLSEKNGNRAPSYPHPIRSGRVLPPSLMH